MIRRATSPLLLFLFLLHGHDAALITGVPQQPAAARARAAAASRVARAAPPICAQQRRQQRQPPREMVLMNEAVGQKFDEVRVIVDVPGAADEMLGVMSADSALAEAKQRSLDLVVMSAGSSPPVCKIVSYDKYRFEQEKKKKEQKKNVKASELKELKMSYKIGDHDFEVRRKRAVKFLTSGDKVKFSILFRGREIAHSEVGKAVMDRMADSLEECGVVDAQPRVMGRQMIMMVTPKPKQKGVA